MHSFLYLLSKNAHFHCLTIVCHKNLRFFKVQPCLCVSLYIRTRLGILSALQKCKETTTVLNHVIEMYLQGVMQRCAQITTTASQLSCISELPSLHVLKYMQCSTCHTYITGHLIISKDMSYPKPENKWIFIWALLCYSKKHTINKLMCVCICI